MGGKQVSNLNDQFMSDGNDTLDEFELRLRAQALGSSPKQRDEILYQCAYAAGIAASMKQRRARVMQWQVVSAAASLLACVALASHYLPHESINDARQTVQTVLHSEGTHQLNALDSEQTSNFFIALLTKDRSADSQQRGSARTAGMKPNDLEVNELEGAIVPTSQDSNGTTLQPKDFQLFFQGEV